MEIGLSYLEIKRMRSELLSPPRTQMGIVTTVKKFLQEVKNYGDEPEKSKKGTTPGEKPKLNLDLKSLARGQRGEIPAHIECETENEIGTALDIAEEFGIKIILERSMEAYKFADEIHKKGIPRIVGPSRGGWGETLKQEFDTFQNPRRLAEAGVKIAIQSENFGSLLTYPRALTIEAAWR